MSKEELVELVRRIIAVDGTEQEVDRMIEVLCANVPHPEVTDLIFYSDIERTPAEIVEVALSYKPIQL